MSVKEILNDKYYRITISNGKMRIFAKAYKPEDEAGEKPLEVFVAKLDFLEDLYDLIEYLAKNKKES